MKWIIKNKKSILTGIGFLFFLGFGKAQDSTSIIQLLQQKKYALAKDAVDRLLTEKETATRYMLKALVYDSIAKSPASNGLLADGRWQSFLALKKAISLYNGTGTFQGQQLAQDLYNGFIQEGLANFNAAVEKNDKLLFETALSVFKKAEQVNGFQHQQNWEAPASNLLLASYLSKSAIYAEKEGDAEFYSKKYIDNTEARTSEIVYQWLLYYYSKRKDTEAFYKYLDKAKAVYPNSNFFLLTEIDWLRQQLQYDTLFTRYQQLITANPSNPKYQLAYCRDIFNSLWPINTGAGKTAEELINLVKPLVRKKETETEACLLLAKSYSNMARQNLTPPTNNDLAKSYLKFANNYLQKVISNNSNIQHKKEGNKLLAANKKILNTIEKNIFLKK